MTLGAFMTLKKIDTAQAPKAIGPYSQAIISPLGKQLIFVSGQLPLDPETGVLVQGDIRVLTNRVLDNLEAILVAGGSRLHQMVRVDIFLKNMSDFADMNEEYAKRVNPALPPARQTVEVSALPKGALIEISCIAFV